MSGNGSALSQYIEPPTRFIDATEEVRLAYRRMEAMNVRTLFVVKDDALLGVVEWQDVRELHNSSEPLEAHVHADVPTVRDDMNVDEVLAIFDETDVTLGQLPVVNSENQLIGEISREEFQARFENITPEADASLSGDEAAPTPGLNLQPGFKVIGSDGEKLGTFERITERAGRPAALIVKHGLFRNKHKRVPFEEFDSQTGDNIMLKIDKAEFKILGDL